MSRFKLTSLFFFGIAILAQGRSDAAWAKVAECNLAMGTHFEVLPNVGQAPRVIRRQKMVFSDGTFAVVYLDKPPRDAETLKEEKYSLKRILNGPRFLSTRGKLIHNPAYCDVQNLCAMNCHGYACLVEDIPGIQKNTWIQAVGDANTENKSPLQVILDHYFEKVVSYQANDNVKFETDERVHEGDLIVLSDKDNIPVHSGVVVKHDRFLRNPHFWVQSKIGEYDVVESPLENLWIYPFSQVVIYRRPRF